DRRGAGALPELRDHHRLDRDAPIGSRPRSGVAPRGSPVEVAPRVPTDVRVVRPHPFLEPDWHERALGLAPRPRWVQADVADAAANQVLDHGALPAPTEVGPFDDVVRQWIARPRLEVEEPRVLARDQDATVGVAPDPVPEPIHAHGELAANRDGLEVREVA